MIVLLDHFLTQTKCELPIYLFTLVIGICFLVRWNKHLRIKYLKKFSTFRNIFSGISWHHKPTLGRELLTSVSSSSGYSSGASSVDLVPDSPDSLRSFSQVCRIEPGSPLPPQNITPLPNPQTRRLHRPQDRPFTPRTMSFGKCQVNHFRALLKFFIGNPEWIFTRPLFQIIARMKSGSFKKKSLWFR